MCIATMNLWGKIDCDFATPFNAVWSKHDGVIIVKYD